MSEPWDDWIPGVLNKEQMGHLLEKGLIIGKPKPEWVDSLDESSLDVSLSDEAFKMTGGSAKPSQKDKYSFLLEQLGEPFPASSEGIFTLEPRKTYVFKLRERLNQRLLMDAQIYGQATAKSSVGRVDVLARLIVDGMDTYECFDAAKLANSNGDMYLEVTPITFYVKVREGRSLSQLRLFRGKPEVAEIGGEVLYKTVLDGPGADNGSLTVDLENLPISGQHVAAFCAVKNSPETAVPLWKEVSGKRPDPCKYWKFVPSDSAKRLKITETSFYLLRSKERIHVPRGVAIYCRASDETIGEMRIHYAGFVHPLFGKERQGPKPGTPLMFEVRGHQVDVSLADGEKMANLTFYRMSQDCGDAEPSPYNEQELNLSNFFESWPTKLRRNADGTVEPG